MVELLGPARRGAAHHRGRVHRPSTSTSAATRSRLAGPVGDVALVSRLVDELVEMAAGGTPLTPDVVTRSVAMLTAAPRARPADVLTFNILSSRGRTIRPKTSGQKDYVDAIDRNTVTFGIGPAGTGKTYLAMAKAVQALQARKVNRIVLTRPAVEAGERLGFLPGTLVGQDRPVPAPAVRRAARHGRPRVDPAAHGGRDHRGRAAGLHARAHAQRRVHHPRRGAEHLDRADEDVPHAARASAPRSSSPATSRRSTCRRRHDVGPARRRGDPRRASTTSRSAG